MMGYNLITSKFLIIPKVQNFHGIQIVCHKPQEM